jgi:hypothetical protein
LFAARAKRRRQELFELAQVTAMAFHKPEGIEPMLRPPIQETLREAERDPDKWEADRWWETSG